MDQDQVTDLCVLREWVEIQLDRVEQAQQGILTRFTGCQDDYEVGERRLIALSEEHGILTDWWAETNAEIAALVEHPLYASPDRFNYENAEDYPF